MARFALALGIASTMAGVSVAARSAGVEAPPLEQEASSEETAYCHILASVRRGHLATAVETTLAAWPRARVMDLLEEVKHLVGSERKVLGSAAAEARNLWLFCRTEPGLAGMPLDRVVGLASYLHARAAMRAWTTSRDIAALRLHLDLVFQWLERLSARQRDPVFERDLLVDVAQFLNLSVDADDAEAFARRARGRWPDDSRIALVVGTVFETSAGHERAKGGRPHQPSLQEALACYRQALSSEPQLEEARLREGRVLTHLGRLEEATAILRPLTETMRSTDLRYLAWLFHGQASLRAGDSRAAEESYREAARHPGARAPWFGLAALAAQTGDRGTATQLLASATRNAVSVSPDDPWWMYEYGQCEVFAQVGRRLDEEVRR